MEKLEFAKFIKVEVVLVVGDEMGSPIYAISRACLNPVSISYYLPSKVKGEEEKYGEVTAVGVSGVQFIVNVSFKEFDKFFDNVERGASFFDND
jgi:hypothetical protein